jgi:hypothetical protein
MNFTKEQAEVIDRAVRILSEKSENSKWTIERTQTVFDPKDFSPYYKIKIDEELVAIASTEEAKFSIDMTKLK